MLFVHMTIFVCVCMVVCVPHTPEGPELLYIPLILMGVEDAQQL